MAVFDFTLRLSAGTADLSSSWKTIRSSFWYNPTDWPMVVFAQPVYTGGPPVTVQVRNAGGATFQARAVSPGGVDATVSCSWVTMPVGSWTVDGVPLEVMKVESGGGASAPWAANGTSVSLTAPIADPVVLGQVQTSNDAWSEFYAWGSTLADPPSSDAITIGHHSGGDPTSTRASETLGVLVMASGSLEVNGVRLQAGRTTTTVPGFDSNNVHAQPLDVDSQLVLASPAGLLGVDGGWPVVKASSAHAVDGTSADLFFDEDIYSDAERGHVLESVAFLAVDGVTDGARFLAQAAWGGNRKDAADAFRRGYGAWIDDQVEAPQSDNVSYLDEITALQLAEIGPNTGLTQEEQSAIRSQYPDNVAFTNAASPHMTNFATALTRSVVYGEDRLRQRIAFVLSQIMVISGNSQLIGVGASVAEYFDGLATHGLGNYRDLIGHVSLHPTMAFYLSSLGNQKASTDGTRQPDENYAREVMQLFSIGLWELEADGTQKRDADGEPIPTYNNDDVTNLARVFTGLWWSGRSFGSWSHPRGNIGAPPRRTAAMTETQHDRQSKTLFSGRDWQVDLPAEVDGIADINAALDGLFNHPNVGPFMARRFIQFLVTSNPSPAYVGRVAAKFDDNGAGVRGDLSAVVQQVLLDVEARGVWRTQNSQHGKMQEPFLRIMQMIMGFKAGIPDGDYAGLEQEDLYHWRWPGQARLIGQWPMLSPSVFNFFQPDSELGGAFRDLNLFAPEMSLLNPVSTATFANELQTMVDWRIHANRDEVTPDFVFNYDPFVALAEDPDALIEELNITLCRGLMSSGTKAVIAHQLNQQTATTTDPRERTVLAAWLAAVSPEAAVLR